MTKTTVRNSLIRTGVSLVKSWGVVVSHVIWGDRDTTIGLKRTNKVVSKLISVPIRHYSTCKIRHTVVLTKRDCNNVVLLLLYNHLIGVSLSTRLTTIHWRSLGVLKILHILVNSNGFCIVTSPTSFRVLYEVMEFWSPL